MTIDHPNHRILIVDDNPAIHADFEKLLAHVGAGANSAAAIELEALEAAILGAPETPTSVAPPQIAFALTHAHQGLEAVELARRARAANEPFAAAFVDMRMPPGIDGLETIERLWAIDPDLQIVVCSAYSDYRWSEIRARLGERDGLLVIKKPFEPIEVVQCAHALVTKWRLARDGRAQLAALRVAIARAQKLEAIGRIAAGISHEINNPLQYLSASMCFLRESAEDIAGDPAAATDFFASVLPEALASIQCGIERIQTISEAMRTIAHPGSAVPVSADLNAVLAGALVLTRPTYNAIADTVVDLAPLPPIACHAGELGQVFVNLIVNAVHAMEPMKPKRGKLGVRSRVADREIEIAISDTGVGIAPDVQARVFDEFFTTKEVGKGTGQGLSISRAVVVEHHAGTLTFTTAPGAGTTFIVRLPLPSSATIGTAH